MSFSLRRSLPGAGGRVFRAVQRFFHEDDWNVERIPGKDALTMGFCGRSSNWRCLAIVEEEREQFAFFSTLDTRVPEEKRRAAAEYLTRANYGLVLGNFELDFSDGEVRYRTSIDVEGGELTHTMIKNLVYSNCTIMDRYLPGLLKVVFGNARPRLAVEEVERAA